jgi:transposase
MILSEAIEELQSLVLLLVGRLDNLEQKYSDLEQENLLLQAANASLNTENASLQSENKELKARLNKNSKNSHKPPSSEGLNKKPVLERLTKAPKSNGGQKGHTGKTLEKVESPDDIVVHHAACCCGCNEALDGSHLIKTGESRQVFDLPAPRLHVTEHQLGFSQCHCGTVTQGEFPAHVVSQTQYGNRIKSLSVMLNIDYKVPVERIQRLFDDLYRCSFNESTVINTNQACFERLESVEQVIVQNLLESNTAHSDETGIRCAGKLHWLHTFCSGLFTFLFVHPNRGDEALSSVHSLVKDFKNWLIHDCWAAYFTFAGCKHGICNAHILRELQALIEDGSIWAKKCQDFLIELYLATEKGTKTIDDLAQKQEWLDKYQAVCNLADEEEPPPKKGKRGKPKNSKGRNLLNRLTKYQDAVLAFAFTEGVPFTNNQAERDIRGVKVKQKISNGFRTLNGAKSYARIQGFISTMRKQQKNVFNELVNVFDNRFSF